MAVRRRSRVKSATAVTLNGPCPTCEAPRYEPCRTVTGARMLTLVHPERAQRARKVRR